MDTKQRNTLIVLIVIIILGYFGWQMWQSGNSGSSGLFTEEPANPFEESTNPYENIKTNPFE